MTHLIFSELLEFCNSQCKKGHRAAINENEYLLRLAFEAVEASACFPLEVVQGATKKKVC